MHAVDQGDPPQELRSHDEVVLDGSEASIPTLGIRAVVERRAHQAQRTGLLGTAGSGAVSTMMAPGTTRCPACRWIAIVCSSGGKTRPSLAHGIPLLGAGVEHHLRIGRGTSREFGIVVIEPVRGRELAPMIVGAYGLTRRESGVLSWVLRGRSNRQIASALRISEYTVQDHLKAIYQKKTGVCSRAEFPGRIFADNYRPH